MTKANESELYMAKQEADMRAAGGTRNSSISYAPKSTIFYQNVYTPRT